MDQKRKRKIFTIRKEPISDMKKTREKANNTKQKPIIIIISKQ